MNKLSISTVLSLVAFAATYEYDFTIGLSDQYFDALNATVDLYVKNSKNPSTATSFKWRSNLVPNSNQTVNGDNVYYRIEDYTKFFFGFESDDPQSRQSIKLRDFYLVPKYLKDSKTIAERTVRICPPQKHQSINARSYVELTRHTC